MNQQKTREMHARRQSTIHADEHAAKIRAKNAEALYAEANRRDELSKERKAAVRAWEIAVEEREMVASSKLAEAFHLLA